MFISIDPEAGWFLGISGNNFENSGATALENSSIIPPLSPIFIIPSHRESTPVSPREISKPVRAVRSEEHTSELQSRPHLVCRLLLEKKKKHTDVFSFYHLIHFF